MSGARTAPDLDAVFRSNQRYLWSVCYRMTGCAADSEDLVQETFARALSRPPVDTNQPWRPWLVRVAVNLSLDHLRRRRRRAYKGPWLPTPIEGLPDLGEQIEPEPSHEPLDTAGRYELLESVSFAFLVALEALTPTQRAVLLLRDVLDYSARESAAALDMSDANVRTTLHRARRAMSEYDRRRCAPSPALEKRTYEVLSRFLVHLAQGDAPELEALLAADVRTLNDAGGQYSAAGSPVIGANKVARFHIGIRQPEGGLRFTIREINGLPAVVGEFETPPKKSPPRFVMIPILDERGLITGLHSVLASEKLAGIAPVPHTPGLLGL